MIMATRRIRNKRKKRKLLRRMGVARSMPDVSVNDRQTLQSVGGESVAL